MRKLTKKEWEKTLEIAQEDLKTYEANYLMAKEMVRFAKENLKQWKN